MGSASGWLERENPAHPREIVGSVRIADPADVSRVVARAAAAQPAWAALPVAQRAARLQAALAAIDDIGALALTMAREMGKPVGECAGEIRFALALAKDMERRALRLLAPTERGEGPGRRTVVRQPWGVVAAVVPWNAPVILAMTKVAPALLSGNAVVLKPSPLAPLCLTAFLEKIAEQLPEGLLAVVNGGAETGDALIAAPQVAKVAFTGGTTVGHAVLRKAAERFVPCTLELGGNDPLIVLEDCDLAPDRVEAMIWGSFLNAGQVCMAAKRIFVHDAILPRFVEAYVETARKILRLGDPVVEGTNLGPLISAQSRAGIERLADEAAASGGQVIPLLEGAAAAALQSDGYFAMPRIVTGLSAEAPLVRNEQFGPIFPIVGWSREDQVLAWIAQSSCLTASVWSSDTERAWSLAGQIEAGLCMVNAHNRSGVSLDLPFGGRGESGFGREYADEGLLEYTWPKGMHIPASGSGAHYPSGT